MQEEPVVQPLPAEALVLLVVTDRTAVDRFSCFVSYCRAMPRISYKL